MDKQQLSKILIKASEYEKSMPISLAKSFIELSDKIDSIKIPEPTDLTAIVNMLDLLENKLEEGTEVELIIE
jgi:hypothetical protein